MTSGSVLTLQDTAVAATSTGKVLNISDTTTGAGYGIYSSMSGAANTGYAIYGNNTSTTGYAVYANGALASTGTASAASFVPTGSTVAVNGLYLPATNQIAFSTASTNALTITATQSVGIGISTPSDKLDVNGGLGFTTTTATSCRLNGLHMPDGQRPRL